MTFIRSTIKTTKIGLTTAVVLAITVACASQGSSTAADASTAMRAVADTGSQSVAPAEKKSTKLVCRKIKPTGSRFGERVCMRPEQWEKYAGQGRREIDRIQSQGLTANPAGG